jgi:actin cytoskeleton-regulatory complex protein SLA1
MASPPYRKSTHREARERSPVRSPLRSPGGFHLYNVNEMVSAMGKRKKMPTTLGLNVATGTIMVSPEKSRDGPSQEWTADKMTHYSIEGKHVFLELIRPSKSLDLHAGAKDTAEEIVSSLGEIAGAVRGEGIREVIAAASGTGGTKRGHMLYDFMAQGDDEVTVAVGDEVIVLDDTKSEEWWMVRRLKNGNEGVVPSSYVEVTGTMSAEPASRSGINAGRSTVEQNRLEEERLAKEAAKRQTERISDAGFNDEPPYIRGVEVGPGMKLPDRGSSLTSDDAARREKRSSRNEGKSSKPKPDPAKTRTWTDRSGSFKVEAQFIGLSDDKIHLHKSNGVKIAVPISKMAPEDLAYVEKATGISLDEDTPLGDLKRKKRSENEAEKSRGSKPGASVAHPKPPEYDWFDFFLKAGVGPHQCERYAQNMKKDSMDESNLPDITPEVLRTLGLKEGDILRIMKHLDSVYGRDGKKSTARNGDGESSGANGSAGGLFSGADGTLRNNTRKGRPEANRVASDVVDAKTFEQRDDGHKSPPPDSRATRLANAPTREKVQSGFDDNAWEVKPSKESAPAAQSAPAIKSPSSTMAQPQLSGAMADLSLLSPPLQPTVLSPQPPPQPAQSQPPQQQPTQPMIPAMTPQQQPQPSGAGPSFFAQLNPQQTGLSGSQPSFAQAPSMQQVNSNFMPMPQLNAPRRRPQAPQQPLSPGSLLPPPPRPLSAPQNFQQQNQFGVAPLHPQLTGLPYASAIQAPPGHSMNDMNQQRLQQQFSQQHQLQPQSTGFSQQGPGFPSFPSGLMPPQPGFQPQGQQFSSQQQQPYMNGNASGSPFADPRPQFQPQPTGFPGFNQQQQGTLPGGINSVLPPPLQPQPTGFQQQVPPPQQQQPQQTGFLQPQQPSYQQQQQPQPQAAFQQPQPTGYQPPAFQQPQPTGFINQPQPAQQQNGFAGPSSSTFQPPPMPPMPQQHAIPLPLQPQKTGPAPPVRFGVVSSDAKKLTPQPTGRRANLAHASEFESFSFYSVLTWGMAVLLSLLFVFLSCMYIYI